MKKTLWIALLAVAGSASAAVSATGSISGVANGSNFDYTIQLTNTGTTTIDAFWFAWIPDINFMPTAATAIGSPAGWTGVSTNNGSAGDGYGIEWTTASAPISIGGSAIFTFTSATTPAQVAGHSSAYPLYEMTRSYVYEGTPLVSPAGVLVVKAVPEPVSLTALASGGLWLIRRKRRA